MYKLVPTFFSLSLPANFLLYNTPKCIYEKFSFGKVKRKEDAMTREERPIILVSISNNEVELDNVANKL